MQTWANISISVQIKYGWNIIRKFDFKEKYISYFLRKGTCDVDVPLGQIFLLVDLRDFFFRLRVGGTKKNK